MSLSNILFSLKLRKKLIESIKIEILIKRFPEINANGYSDSKIRLNKSNGLAFSKFLLLLIINWLRGTDLNRRPQGYEPCELPGCSTPRYFKFYF